MYETRLSRMIMQLPPAQMANRDGDAGMETMLWDINIIPNELDNGYLMLPPGVLHMSALGRFGRFTLFSPRVSHSIFFFALCCLGKILGGAPFSQLHKGGKQSREDTSRFTFQTLAVFCVVLCFGFALRCFCFQFCKCLESRILRAV